jgi:hypothetical protein
MGTQAHARISQGRWCSPDAYQDKLRIEVSTEEIEKRIAELKTSVLKSKALNFAENLGGLSDDRPEEESSDRQASPPRG